VPARRLPAASATEVERARVGFTFDGRRYEGMEGEPVAVSLLAAGRRTLSRSFRFHRPRGLMCSTGQCGWCECEVDGRPSVRTCRVPVRDGMVVRGEHAWPSVEHDLLRGLDLGSRFVPPTFYHHRFLRPRRLRKAYLDVIRSFGGRGRLGNGGRSDARPRAVRRGEPDVLVVGGGRGGLLAAIGAAETGARVVVLEAEEPAADTVAAARGLGVDVRAGSTATGWYAGMVTAMDDEAIWELRPRAVVAATGTYELVPTVPGSDRPGVMSARLVGQVLERDGVLSGDRALLVGEGDELETVGASLREAGAMVLGPIPTAALHAIGGRGPVAWARIVDAGAASARREHVEIVVFGDRTPNLDLVLAAGGRVGWRDGHLAPHADPDGRTSAPGLFVAGDVAGLGTDAATAEAQAWRVGSAAGTLALAAVGAGQRTGTGADPQTGTWAPAAPATMRAGDPPRSPTSGLPPKTRPASAHAVLCFCEDVRGWEVGAEQAAGYTDPELVKRRTGALTGPCQGKYCLSAVTCAMGGAANDGPPGPVTAVTDGGMLLPTGRPPLRPLRLRDLIAVDVPSTQADAGSLRANAPTADAPAPGAPAPGAPAPGAPVPGAADPP
jgi:sarcosine oxidase subunit alpha